MPSPLASSKTCSPCQKANTRVGTHSPAWLFLAHPTRQATGVPYYFLGRVPCRSVSLVAVVVGAVEYESRIVYTREPYYPSHPSTKHAQTRCLVDDGTGTIEYAFRPSEGEFKS